MEPVLPRFTIADTGWYDDPSVLVLLEIGQAALDRACRDGQLRFVKKGRRRWFKGE
jgi:hypothetical protein